jgi:hypothetical protein
MKRFSTVVSATCLLAATTVWAAAGGDAELTTLGREMVAFFNVPRPVTFVAISEGGIAGPHTTINASMGSEGCWTSMGAKDQRHAVGYIIDWTSALRVDRQGAQIIVNQSPTFTRESISWSLPSESAAKAMAVKADRLLALCHAREPAAD